MEGSTIQESIINNFYRVSLWDDLSYSLPSGVILKFLVLCRSLDGRSCKDEIYRMGIGAGYCEGNLNFATASEDDEVYTKKKVSRVSF